MRIGQTSVVHFLSQIVTSVFGFVVTVYLARELGDAVLGNYFLVVAVLVWLKVLGGQGIQMAVRKRISEGTAEAQYLGAGLGLQLVAFVVLAVSLLIFESRVNDYVRTEAAVPLVALLFTGLLFWQVRGALEGRHRVDLSSLLPPLDRSLRGVFQVGVVAVGLGTVWWLLAGYAVAELLVAGIGLLLLAVRPRLPTREQVVSMLDYARYSWFTGIESRTFASMDTLVLGAFSIASGLIGVYEIAWNLASILAVFGTSISTTLFPAISELSSADNNAISGDAGTISRLINDAVAYSGLFVVPGLVGCLVIGDAVLAIYGEEFTRGYTVLVVLVFARLIYVYESQFTNVLAAIDRPEAAFRVNVTFVLTTLVLNVALVASFGWLGAAVATATSALIGLGVSYVALRQYVAVSIPIGELANQAVAAGLMGIVVYSVRGYVGSGTTWTVVLVIVGSTVYFVVLAVLSQRFRTTVGRNLPAIR
jgi:O-antigen/teichoic acid export membrane protein